MAYSLLHHEQCVPGIITHEKLLLLIGLHDSIWYFTETMIRGYDSTVMIILWLQWDITVNVGLRGWGYTTCSNRVYDTSWVINFD